VKEAPWRSMKPAIATREGSVCGSGVAFVGLAQWAKRPTSRADSICAEEMKHWRGFKPRPQ